MKLCVYLSVYCCYTPLPIYLTVRLSVGRTDHSLLTTSVSASVLFAFTGHVADLWPSVKKDWTWNHYTWHPASVYTNSSPESPQCRLMNLLKKRRMHADQTEKQERKQSKAGQCITCSHYTRAWVDSVKYCKPPHNQTTHYTHCLSRAFYSLCVVLICQSECDMAAVITHKEASIRLTVKWQ